jgi:hypothetical protein
VAELSTTDAITRAGRAVGVAAGVPGRAWLVRRLDRPADAYYLVVFGEEDAAVGVATVSRSTGEVGSAARLSGRGPHLEIDAARARELAGAGEEARAELVWRPSTASKSPLYPVWEVELPAGSVYVDQGGAVSGDSP